MNRRFLSCLATLALLVAASSAHAARPAAVIICGSGGEESYTKKFTDWGTRLRTVLTGKLNFPESNVWLLTEAGGPGFAGVSDLETIKGIMDAASKKVTAEQDFFVFLIGHGSYLKQVSKFQIPGLDLTADDLKTMLAAIPARKIAIIDSTSASAGFINVLSGPNRIVASATKSTSEKNATTMMEFFIQGLEDGSADLNRDERITFLEACRQASALTEAWFHTEGFIASEHPLIDDNGDGLGSRIAEIVDEDLTPAAIKNPKKGAFDGASADLVLLKDYSFPAGAPRELIDKYLALLDKITDLKANKEGAGGKEYYSELERLLVEAAKTNREIRGFASKSASQSAAAPASPSGGGN